jgi:hypothetical protein
MPKKKPGVFIKCEKTVKLFIMKLNKKEKIIIEELDDENSLFIYKDKLNYVQEQVYKMQDENAEYERPKDD